MSSVASRVWMTTGRSSVDAPAPPGRRTPRAARPAARSRSGSRGRSRRPRPRRLRRTARSRDAPRRSAARPAYAPARCGWIADGEAHRRPGAPHTAARARARRLRRPTGCTARASTPAACAPRDDRVEVGANASSARWQCESIRSHDALPDPRARRRRLVERHEHRLAAVGAGGEHHAVRLDAHQLRGLQVGDDHDVRPTSASAS